MHLEGSTEISSGQNQVQKSPPTYEQLNEAYMQEGFTSRLNDMLHIITLQQEQYSYLLLLNMCKTFHFNLFELVFLAKFIQKHDKIQSKQSKYNRHHEYFQPQNQYFSSETNKLIQKIALKSIDQGKITRKFQNSNNSSQYQLTKKIQKTQIKYLYLLTVGFGIKYYLNKQTDSLPYLLKVKALTPNFQPILTQWIKKFGSEAFIFDPRQINYIYRKIVQNQNNNEQNDEQKEGQLKDYNQIAVKVLQISEQIKRQQNQRQNQIKQKKSYEENNHKLSRGLKKTKQIKKIGQSRN